MPVEFIDAAGAERLTHYPLILCFEHTEETHFCRIVFPEPNMVKAAKDMQSLLADAAGHLNRTGWTLADSDLAPERGLQVGINLIRKPPQTMDGQLASEARSRVRAPAAALEENPSP